MFRRFGGRSIGSKRSRGALYEVPLRGASCAARLGFLLAVREGFEVGGEAVVVAGGGPGPVEGSVAAAGGQRGVGGVATDEDVVDAVEGPVEGDLVRGLGTYVASGSVGWAASHTLR